VWQRDTTSQSPTCGLILLSRQGRVSRLHPEQRQHRERRKRDMILTALFERVCRGSDPQFRRPPAANGGAGLVPSRSWQSGGRGTVARRALAGTSHGEGQDTPS